LGLVLAENYFYDDGKYNVYAYDKYDNFLASGAVKINFKD